VALWTYKTVLITGGTGTFSHAMTRYLLEICPHITIRLLSRDEFKQQKMHQEFFDARLRFLIGDVRDVERLNLACQGVDLVIHAAALKHIDRGEHEPLEFIKTNVRGTENVIAACHATGVQQAIFLSTDKSVHAINTYGSTKALAERLWVQANGYQPHGTRFAAVRYGNVMGSRGSVVEVWRNALENGQQIRLTHPDMSRFWMSPQEAVRLVYWTALHGLRGGVVVPHLPSFLMTDLASAMLKPIETYAISGIRPGEKLAEQLMTDDEEHRAYFYASSTKVPVFYVIPPILQHWGGSDERALWQVAPDETVYGRCEHDVARQVTYRSDVWPWKLTVDDLAQRLKDV
jgi:UDP-N-acetylglucosamine 4,6-dehydratase/5-epimerase